MAEISRLDALHHDEHQPAHDQNSLPTHDHSPPVPYDDSRHACIVLQCNVSGRGLVDVVQDIQDRINPIVQADSWPLRYSVRFEGQFQNQASASRTIGVLFAVSLVGVFLVLFSMFRSVSFSLQVLAALPMAFIGSVAALLLTKQTLSIASLGTVPKSLLDFVSRRR